MKKAIFTLATPLLLAATAANAASIIKTDNSSLDIYGRAKFTAKNDSVKGSSSSFSPRLGVKGQINDGNGTSAFFQTGWDMSSSADSAASNNTETTDVADFKDSSKKTAFLHHLVEITFQLATNL